MKGKISAFSVGVLDCGALCGEISRFWVLGFGWFGVLRALKVGKRWQSIKVKNSMRWCSLSIDVFRKVISLNLYCRVIL
ncbi:hypothetical protein Pfo_004343 [Paulownia fortunei]|nr:hypothetical protein Pfo_004343 [Paulownia fortunei]